MIVAFALALLSLDAEEVFLVEVVETEGALCLEGVEVVEESEEVEIVVVVVTVSVDV